MLILETKGRMDIGEAVQCYNLGKEVEVWISESLSRRGDSSGGKSSCYYPHTAVHHIRHQVRVRGTD